jgi:hypothetical protein
MFSAPRAVLSRTYSPAKKTRPSPNIYIYKMLLSFNFSNESLSLNGKRKARKKGRKQKKQEKLKTKMIIKTRAKIVAKNFRFGVVRVQKNL